MARRTIALILLVGASMLAAGCRPQIDRAAADKLAQTELAKYAGREGLALSNFSPGEVTDHGKAGWLYSYKYRGDSQHLLSIIVH